MPNEKMPGQKTEDDAYRTDEDVSELYVIWDEAMHQAAGKGHAHSVKQALCAVATAVRAPLVEEVERWKGELEELKKTIDGFKNALQLEATHVKGYREHALRDRDEITGLRSQLEVARKALESAAEVFDSGHAREVYTRNCAEGWGMTEIDACLKIRTALSPIPKESA
jgi:hypothetical protein